jgi:SAM-dependent methyltransferase
MRPRIILARFLKRLGRFISSLALMVMRPDDLVEFSRQTYAENQQVKHFASAETINKGLKPMEKAGLEKINLTQGKILVLCLGGGREAIPLAKMGFSVTGVDFIPELVEMAKKNAANQGVHLEVQVEELSHLTPPAATFDVVWLSEGMYSCIPTRKRRIEMLLKMHDALRPGGWFVCMFSWYPSQSFSPRVDRWRKFFAYLSLGNLWYEPGDDLLGENEFIHRFGNESELDAEFAEGGFEVMRPYLINTLEHRGLALLQKATEKNPEGSLHAQAPVCQP